MASVTLGPLFAYPIHPASWRRPPGDLGYRVTNTFTGPDYLNGGQHRATDVGNFRPPPEGDPVLMPIDGMARGLRHTDGALGVEVILGGVVTLELWHLNHVRIPFTWTRIPAGVVIGATGNSGAKLPTGQAMPSHTHIAAKRDGMPFDVEPHLPMPERPALPIVLEADDVKIPAGSSPLAIGVVGAGSRLRSDPMTADGSRVLDQAYQVQVFTYGVLGEPYTLGGKRGDRYAWVGQFGELWYVAEPLLSGVFLTDRAPQADCTALENKLAAATTAVDGAAQAIAAAQGALRR